MSRLLLVLAMVLLTTTNLSAGTMVTGVGAITTNINNPGNTANFETAIINTGTVLDGIYGTESLGAIVDNYTGSLGWGDNLIIKATAEVNNEGTVAGADQAALLGYFGQSFSTGHRSEAGFAILIDNANEEQLRLYIGGNQAAIIGNWNSQFGRNSPFDINLSASEAGGILTVTGTITDSDNPGNQIVVNSPSAVNPGETLLAFGVSSSYAREDGTNRTSGIDLSNMMYISTIPEPGTIGLALIGLSVIGWRRRSR